MLVYRVENSERTGPYSGRRSTDLAHHFNERTHPGPWGDGLGDVLCSYHRFGFKSLEQLRVWFSVDDRSGLRGDGYHLATYEVPWLDVKHGEKQIIFDYAEAKLVETFDLVEETPITVIEPHPIAAESLSCL